MRPYEYLERAVQLEKLAADETDPKFKAQLLKQAEGYRKLAHKQAEKQQLTRLDRTK